MVIITTLYCLTVYLVFFKFKLLPWNKATQGIALVLGIVILTGFLVGLQGLTPASVQAFITGPITEIAPQVSGEVISVPAKPNQPMDVGEVIFQLDPRRYQFEVDRRIAQLASTESDVAQLKESYDAARARVRSTEAELALTRQRLVEQEELVATGAGTRFELDQFRTQEQQLVSRLESDRANENAAYISLNASVGDQQADLAEVLAQLDSAQFDLEQTTVRAPTAGVVTVLTVRPGLQVSRLRPAATFVNTSELMIVAYFQQKALNTMRLGDTAKINFPALPGQLFEGEVLTIPEAIGEGQFFASGQLPRVSEQRMTRLYPVLVSIPDDFPPDLRKVGLAASVRIHTEGAGVVGIVAVILQWVQTSLDAVI